MKYTTIEEIKDNCQINQNGCWEWKGQRNDGYAAVYKDKSHKKVKVTRVVLEMLGNDMSNKKIYACHTCDNKICVNPDHLFLGTSSDNQKDHWRKVKAGTVKRTAGGRMFHTIFGPLNLEGRER